MFWSDQSNNPFQLWVERQQDAYKSMTGIGEAAAIDAIWKSSLEQWVTFQKQGWPKTGITEAELRMLFDPSQWAQACLGQFDLAIEHLIDGPSYATLWDLDRKMLKAQFLRFQRERHLLAYHAVVRAAWSQAFERFFNELNDPNGAPITSWRELADLWVALGNETLIQMHRSPEFLDAQRRLTRSASDCRLQEREIAEAFCEMHHIPTRTEMDEVQRALYELRRTLRAQQPKRPSAKVTKELNTPSAKKRNADSTPSSVSEETN